MEKFKRAWNNYSVTIENNTKSEKVLVATLLIVIGAEEARKAFTTFTWESEGDEKKITTVLDKSLVRTVNHRETYPLSVIDSTDELWSQGSLMNNIAHL